MLRQLTVFQHFMPRGEKSKSPNITMIKASRRVAEKITQLALGGGRANPRTGVIVVHWCYVEGGRGLRVMLTVWSSSHM